jgi:methionyl-tRNA formyltransferase
VRLVFAGTPEVALASLDLLLASPRHDVVAVVTRPDTTAGRGRQRSISPVKARAQEHGIEVLTPVRASDPDFLNRLRDIAPDCCPVVAYGALIPQAALDIPTKGWVNLHFSLLPAWRGAAPVQHALLAGDEITGASTFQIEAGLDTGPIFGTTTTVIGPDETAGELLQRLATQGAGLLAATLDGIEDGTLEPKPQSTDGVSLAPKLTPNDARIDWTAPALRIDRLVRACTPAPGPWTNFRDARLKLGRVTVAASDLALAPSALALAPGHLVLDADGNVRVGTGSDPVLLSTVQPQGKSAMPAAAWARGARLGVNERFE